MVKKEHQLRKQEDTKKKILDMAANIVSQEGFKGLSIRKITNTLDYSPGIIYHYFKNKNEIIKTLVNEGYDRLLTTVNFKETNEAEPEKEIKEVFTNYIKVALESPEYYKEVMLSNDSSILNKTALLEKGICEKSPTLKILCKNIERGIRENRYASCDPELTAQIIWTSTFGLIMKLIIEKDISKKQVNRLIDNHFNILFNGLMKRKK